MRIRSFLAALMVLALPPVLLLACGDREAEVAIPDTPEEIVDADLLGHWVVVETNGEMPAEEVRYFFTPQGELVRTSDADTVATRAQYSFVAEGQLSVTDASGTRLYDYAITPEGSMTMTETSEDGTSHRLRRIADMDLRDVPPPASTNIPEDSVPSDSMGAAPTDTSAQ